MAKILNAECSASGIVTVEGYTVPDVVIMSEGKQASTGILILEGGAPPKYFPSSATDVKATIDKITLILDDLTSALSTIATTLTSIGAGMTGSTTAPPGTLPTNVATINSKVTALTTKRSELETLKEALK